jgi:hypothetical protein
VFVLCFEKLFGDHIANPIEKEQGGRGREWNGRKDERRINGSKKDIRSANA